MRGTVPTRYSSLITHHSLHLLADGDRDVLVAGGGDPTGQAVNALGLHIVAPLELLDGDAIGHAAQPLRRGQRVLARLVEEPVAGPVGRRWHLLQRLRVGLAPPARQELDHGVADAERVAGPELHLHDVVDLARLHPPSPPFPHRASRAPPSAARWSICRLHLALAASSMAGAD